MDAQKIKITVIGIGNMGSGIARRLMANGHPVVVFDLSSERMAAMAEAGAVSAGSPQTAVREADLVITSLLGDNSVEQSVLSEAGFLSAMKPGAIHLCVTTISPDCANRIASAHASSGSRFVAGPVAGRPDAAAAGQLTTYLAGDASAIEVVATLAPAYATKIVRIEGPAGLANAMKLSVNYTAISIIELMGEIYAFAEKVGLDRALLRNYFQDAFNRPALKMYANKLHDHSITGKSGFALVTGLKDVNLMLDAANGCGVNFEIGAIAKRKMLKAIDMGLSTADWSSIAQVTRTESGVPLTFYASSADGELAVRDTSS